MCFTGLHVPALSMSQLTHMEMPHMVWTIDMLHVLK